MKKIVSILWMALIAIMFTSCHQDQVAIENLNDIVTNFETQYKQLSEEQMATIEADYAKALSRVEEFHYSQLDNERIGSIKARYDKTKLKYDIINAKRNVNELFDQVVGYGKEIIDILENDSI